MSLSMVSETLIVHHKDEADLRGLLARFHKKPRFLLIYHSIWNQLQNNFPHTKLHLYSATIGESTYWFGYKENTLIKPFLLLCSEGPIVENNFVTVFEALWNLLKQDQSVLICGDRRMTDIIIHNFTDFNYHFVKDNKYYMTENQMKMVQLMDKPTLPEGYELGHCTPDDAELITETWAHAGNGEVDMTRIHMKHLLLMFFGMNIYVSSQKLISFPSSGIRFNGQLVAHIMVDPNGNLNHQYVYPEHRRKGLGNILEIDVSQKLISSGGFIVFKTVELDNKEVLAATNRSKWWTRAVQDDGSEYTIVFLDMTPKGNK